ncbi:two-component system VirA-like sensor kinase [Rhizobium leguminosarum]|uniref:two-component system VirA-like sensor kinase n=1 Tax=Rhizobium TaxID=379 RepID=UPI001030ED60|nr:two-component system VirA-like sensor kinase [Rhizobium leguminosarum]TBF87429.1 two-component system VirA-like sensor kinase [Rhizobium leguminosarum]TBG07044.1 two-component system VirA-like sensor kinase [Rhizobium leguminosarum]TBG07806.1 two-component system VirA-like sensor kinase [Rhizobium leguminosarum]TBG30735.1 two-component system VirA-like sensor kinase [Rhizobium leguminosarum]TBG50105.1 two-component system VirA-like sensor kinase [Rhizobium leguminosarum]
MRKLSELRILRHADKPIGFVIAIMAAIVFALLAAGRGPDRDSHDAILTTLRTIDLANSSLQRDVLQARSGLLNNYDPLITSIATLHETMSRLKILSVGEPMAPRLPSELSRLESSIARAESLVERFKTDNALLQNSLSIFSVVLSEIPRSQIEPVLPPEWSELGNVMLRFSTHPDPDLARRILDLLARVPEAELSRSARLRSIASHGVAILKFQPLVDDLVRQIQTSETSARTQDFQREYLSVYGEMNVRATWARRFLGAVAVVLCLYVIFLVYRLRLQTDRLARRLKFENSRNVIKAVFDDQDTGDGAEPIETSLEEISSFFEAGCEFLIFDVERGAIEERYHTSKIDADVTGLIDEYRSDLARVGDDTRRRRARRFHKSLRSQGELPFTRDSLTAGAVVGLPISVRFAALMILEYSESRSRTRADDVMMMHDTLELLTRCLDRFRKGQERDLLESRLAHAERLQAVGTLAAGIAHEFNNILVFMLGYGEMALQIIKRPPQARRYIEGILSAGERARKIIEQILALSRKRERTSKPFDLCEAVSNVVSLISISLPETYKIATFLPSQPMVILGNPVELQQIIVNLCNNALEAASGKGEVQIDVRVVATRMQRAISHGVLPPGRFVCLSIADNGPGISESVMPHIFEPFFTTKTLSGGTGLGLATVHGHITAHGGFINVVSVIGKSTRFDIFFPTCDEEPIPLKAFFDREDLALGNGQTILLIEADVSLRHMHEEKLAALSYEPVGFASLPEALNWLGSTSAKPDASLVDVASLAEHIEPSDLERLLEGIPYLLIADPRRTGPLSMSSLRGIATLKEPIDLRSLAAMLHRITVAQPQ